MVPGYTDSEENMTEIANLAKRYSCVEKVSLLPYNSATGAKYLSIGRSYPLEQLEPWSLEKMESLSQAFTAMDIPVDIGR